MQCSLSRLEDSQHSLYVSLGSNLGDREQIIQDSLELLSLRVGQLQAVAPMLETEPVGFASQHRFLNTVALFSTPHAPRMVLELTQQIERELGRKTKSRGGIYADRPIDIDLLIYDDLCLQTDELTIPHPRMHERLFVLQPLAAIAPKLRHPLLGRMIEDLLLDLI